MARAIHWQIPFVSLDGIAYTVNIYEDDYEGDVVTLTGASSPIVTDEEEDVDPFVPIRTHSGYIRIINNGDIDGLIPETNTSRFVTLTTSDDTVVWQGFLCAESFSQNWDATPYEIEIPIQSPLALLDSKEMDYRLGLATITIGDLIREAFVQMGFSDMYDTFSIDEVGDILTVLNWQVSRFNWFKRNTSEDDGTGDWVEYTGNTYKELLEDIFNFMGMCLVERGRHLYAKAMTSFIDQYDRGKQYSFTSDFSDFLAGDDTAWEGEYYDAIDFSTLVIAGADHQESITPGYRKVTVDAKINAIGDLTEDIDADGHDVLDTCMEYRDQYLNPTTTPADYYYYARTRLRTSMASGSQYTLHVYDGLGENIEVDYPTAYNDDLGGCMIVDFDVYNKTDIEEGKKNYSYSQGILCHSSLLINGEQGSEGTVVTPDYGWDDKVGFSLLSGERALFNNGYICLSMNTQTMDSLKVRKCNGLGQMIIGLRIGDKYWDGLNWSSTPSTFYVKFGSDSAEHWYDEGSGQIIDTKTLDMDCNGASGYIIPITSQLSGDVELRFICAWSFIGGWDSSTGQPRYLCVESVNVEYYSPDTEALSSKTTNSYAKATGKDYVDEKSVTLNIASNNNNKKGYGLLTYNNSFVTTADYKVKGLTKTIRPEQYLLESMADIYSHYLRSIVVTAKHNDAVTPLYRLKDSSNFVYYVTSESTDWREGTTDYQIVELTY